MKVQKIESRQLGKTKVIVIDVPTATTSYVSLSIPVGSRFDPEGCEGAAHFLEHLLMIRSQDQSDEIERYRFLERNGLVFNASVNKETMTFQYEQPVAQTLLAIEDMLIAFETSLFTKEDVEKEREIILTEESQYRDDPEEYIDHLSFQNIFNDTSLSRPVLGTPESIARLTREDLVIFKGLLKNNHRTLIVVGDVKAEETFQFLERLGVSKESYTYNSNETEAEKNNIVPFFHLEKEADNTTLAITYQTTSIHNIRDQVILHFINHCLAGGWSSRLTTSLRIRRGLVYWIDGEVFEGRDTGFIRFITSADPSDIDEVVQLIQIEVNELKNKLLYPKELAEYKSGYIANLILGHSDLSVIGNWYEYASTLGVKQMSLEEYIEEVNKITSEEIVEIANKYFTEDRCSVVTIGKEKRM